MEQAVAAARGSQAFGAVSGGNSRYESGSHVDVKSVNLMLGMSHGLSNSAGNLTLGGFVEFGHGGYDRGLMEQRLRDVLGFQIGDGTAQIMKTIIARARAGRKFVPA